MSQRIIQTGNPILTERPIPRVPSNTFNWNHDFKCSFNMGELIPILTEECLPGDYWKIEPEALVRLAPMIAPMQQRVTLRTFTFFVPYRLVWPGWEEFIAPSMEGSIPPALPFFSDIQVNVRSLSDYLGLPLTNPDGTTPEALIDKVSALYHYAYKQIWEQWFRDENVASDMDITTAVNGDNSGQYGSLNVIKNMNWDRDYFTSALPFAQKGPSVVIPITTHAVPVTYRDNGEIPGLYTTDASAIGNEHLSVVEFSPGSTGGAIATSDTGKPLVFDPRGTLEVNTADMVSSAGTINDLRTASALQRWLEADARGGTRYIETIYTHFGQNSSDSRLQRPEYCGSTSQPIVISEVLQTSETDASPQGNMAGHGITARRHGSVSHKCEEHGVLMTLASVLPTTAYYQGIPRKFSKYDRLDFAWPELADIGEQPILNREIKWTYLGANDATFGYIPRYGEYRLPYNRVSGEYRTNLDYWHMGRKFDNIPVLDAGFIESDPTTRVFAVTSPFVEHLYAHFFFDAFVDRKLPKYVIPELK